MNQMSSGVHTSGGTTTYAGDDGSAVPYDVTYRTSAKIPSMLNRMRYRAQVVQGKSQRPPWLAFTTWFWILVGGWIMFILFVFAALGMMLTIVFIPYGIKALRYAVYELNPIMRGSYYEYIAGESTGFFTRVTLNHRHPYTIAANVIWLLFFGWELALAHIFLGLIHVLLIVGIPTGLRHFSLIPFALWPFGSRICIQDPVPFPAGLHRSETQTVTGTPVNQRMPPPPSAATTTMPPSEPRAYRVFPSSGVDVV